MKTTPASTCLAFGQATYRTTEQSLIFLLIWAMRCLDWTHI